MSGVFGAVRGTLSARKAARTCCPQMFPWIAPSAFMTTEYAAERASKVRHGGSTRTHAGFLYASDRRMKLSGCSAAVTT